METMNIRCGCGVGTADKLLSAKPRRSWLARVFAWLTTTADTRCPTCGELPHLSD